MVHLLEQEFKDYQEQNDVDQIEMKIRNIRFIGELTKFNLCPHPLTLECLRQLLADFRYHNIELIGDLLGICGLFLTRSDDEGIVVKVNNYLDILWRLKEKELTIPQK